MEGPQVRALAHRLSVVFWGHRLERIDVPTNRWHANVLLKHCAGRQVLRIYSHGCWLIWNFEHGVSWLCYPLRRWNWEVYSGRGEALSHLATMQSPAPTVKRKLGKLRGRPLLRIVLDDNSEIQLSGRPLFLTLLTPELWRHPHLADVGPDPLGDELSEGDWRFRLRGSGGTIARALMDQRVVAGIGNQGKCEILHASGLHPATITGEMTPSKLQRLAGATKEYLTMAYRHYLNEASEERICRVHDRAGEPCESCGTQIAVDRCGRDGHWTWYCPKCQPVGNEPMLFENW